MPRHIRDQPEELTPREQDRLRRRDARRTTTMVVDNAAVKRTQLALQRGRSKGLAGGTGSGPGAVTASRTKSIAHPVEER